MKQQDAKPEQALPHDLILEGRNKLTVTGVRRVIRCDAEGAAMLTSKGTLELTGAELSVRASTPAPASPSPSLLPRASSSSPARL